VNGMTFGPPDYVGIGAQRSGTSWWHRLIAEHPGVYRAPGLRKELHYFDHRWKDLPVAASTRRYHERFPRPAGQLTGEWTPRYLFDFWVPARLQAAAPNARLLVLLRDPIERFQSGVTYALAHGHRLGREVLEEAFGRGLYHLQLSRLLDWFAREQLLVLQYEQCCQDSTSQLRRTYEFLGLDPTFESRMLAKPVNATTRKKVGLREVMRRELRAGYRVDCRQLAQDFPEIKLEHWRTWTEG
jgi:Sulfotransferase domain